MTMQHWINSPVGRLIQTVVILLASISYTGGVDDAVYLPSLLDLSIGKPTFLQPGGDTKCLLGAPFQFQVTRGEQDKLLIFFGSGGLCWDERSVMSQSCHTHTGKLLHSGILTPTSESKWGPKFNEYTAVVIPQCSGDMHLGHTARGFKGPKGEAVAHRGIINFKAVLDWLQLQQQQGTLAAPIAELIIVGASTGGFAASLLTYYITNTLKHQKAATIIDSMEILMPEGALNALFHVYGACDIFQPFLSANAFSYCTQRSFKFADFFVELAGKTPHVPFAFVHSHADSIARMHYNVLLRAVGGTAGSELTRSSDQMAATRETLLELTQKVPNCVMYIIDSTEHIFINRDRYFTADASGGNGSARFYGPKLREWVEMLPLTAGRRVQSVCSTGEKTLTLSTSNCPREVAKKSYLQPAHY